MPRKVLLLSLLLLVLASCKQDPADASPVEPDQVDQPIETPMPVELTATAKPETLFEGSWFTDQLSLDIFLPPDDSFIFVYADNNASSCGGALLRALGSAEVSAVNTISLTGTSTCENSSDESPFALDLIYDPAENVLRDSSGNVWIRS